MDAKNAQTQPTSGEQFPAESQLIFGDIFDFYGRLDQDGRVIDLSGSIFETTNTNPRLLTGQKFSETVFWQSSEITSKLLEKAIENGAEGEKSRLILDFRISADEKSAMEVRVLPLSIADSDVEIFIAGQSVAERKGQVEHNEGASEQLLFAAENAAIGLWFWDFQENRIHATPRCNELFGLPAYET